MASAVQAGLRDSLLLELRRGSVILAVLALLRHEEYGYSLVTHLAERGVPIDEGTLYPLLRRLEGQGLLDSRWDVSESRPRRYYKLNAMGARLLKDVSGEWRGITQRLDSLLP